MTTAFQNFIRDSLVFSEAFAAIIAILYYFKLKNTFWKGFVAYIVFIATINIFIELWILPKDKALMYDLVIVPTEFLFFIWLYALQSLKSKNLFWICVVVYLLAYIPHLFYKLPITRINEMSYNTGCLLLFVLVLLEFKKQIQNDDILLFKQNKMFYINIGVTLFYVGSLPFFAFNNYLYKNAETIFMNYYTYMLLSNNLMYGLFAASFLWGKPNT